MFIYQRMKEKEEDTRSRSKTRTPAKERESSVCEDLVEDPTKRQRSEKSDKRFDSCLFCMRTIPAFSVALSFLFSFSFA